MANLGVNGYTSADLIREELPALADLQPEFATRAHRRQRRRPGRAAAEAYEANVVTILDTLLGRLPADRIVTVADPGLHRHPGRRRLRRSAPAARRDRGRTTRHGPARRGAGIAFVDIFDISLRAADDRSLVADDGLHPSGTQYGLWVERIAARGGAAPRAADRAGLRSAPGLQLVEPRVADPEVMGDLVIDRVRDRRGEPLGRPVGPGQRSAEDRDLARGADLVGGPGRVAGTPWYRPYRPCARTDASCSGVASSSMTMATDPSRSRNGGGQPLEGVDHERLQVGVVGLTWRTDRIGHRVTIRRTRLCHADAMTTPETVAPRTRLASHHGQGGRTWMKQRPT